jgi:hypothetical protein
VRTAWLLLASPLACAAEWKPVAYPGFVQSIDVLAGPTARDCGWLNLMETRPRGKVERAAYDCVQAVLKGSAPFKFGAMRIFADSQKYEVVVRQADGKLWLISYEVMLEGEAPQQWNQVCRDISVEESLVIKGEECAEHSRGKLRKQ